VEQLDPVIEGDVAEEIDKLKRQPGKDILVFGSGNLVNALMRHNLIDEYLLMVFPIVVGGGIDTKVLKLAGTKVFGSGVVVLTYEPAGEEADG
jgi:dihydrofolate reductase